MLLPLQKFETLLDEKDLTIVELTQRLDTETAHSKDIWGRVVSDNIAFLFRVGIAISTYPGHTWVHLRFELLKVLSLCSACRALIPFQLQSGTAVVEFRQPCIL